MVKHGYAVILAGGAGTRLWPLSRQHRPKQHLRLFGRQTLLQAAYERARKLFAANHIFIATDVRERRWVQQQLPALATSQLLLEPEKRGTAAAIGRAAVHILSRDPAAIMMTLNADAYVENQQRFLAALRALADAANSQPARLFLIGIPPLYPETGYGYILSGRKAAKRRGFDLFHVRGFREKPNEDVAERYVAHGRAYWNPTILVGRASHFLTLYAKHLPRSFAVLEHMRRALQAAKSQAQRERVERSLFRGLEKSDINYHILEREKHMILLVANGIGWADIGHWKSINDMLGSHLPSAIRHGPYVGIDSSDNFIHVEGKLVATVGVKGFVIVETPDALLVCRKDRAQEVKRVVAELARRGLKKYL